MKRLAAAFGLSLLLALPVRADIITLDDGTKIEGEVVKETKDEIKVKIPYGATTFPRSRVVKIEKKATPEQELKERHARLDKNDAAGRIELAHFALDKHFPRQKVAELAVEAWRIAPGDEGAIDILAVKLDYHYEKDVWVDPDHWYPAHGYVRKGTSFITQEEQTALDAAALVRRLESGLAVAELDVKTTEDAIATAPARTAKARADAADAETDARTASAAKETAKATADARETDLKIAADRTLAARRDLMDVQQSNASPELVNRAALLVNAAAADELKARRARDAALADLDAVTAREVAATKRAREAKAVADAIRADAKAAQAALPAKKAARDAAKDRLEAGMAAEAQSKIAVTKRTERDAKDAQDRIAALRALKK